jgi:hypothetical protein
MFKRARETGPAFWIPAAWGVVIAAHLDIVSTRPMLVMHAVMSVVLVAFAVASWGEMQSGVLRAWRSVILVGTPFALAGLAGFLRSPGATWLRAAALGGWMLLPAWGFIVTSRAATEGAWIHAASAGGCLLGAGLYAGGAVAGMEPLQIAGLAVVGIGQTAGILDAVLRY